jgi:DNA-binding NarL/FixJ family response regulator
MTKIIIADDHDITLHGLVSVVEKMVDISIVGTAKTGIEAINILKIKEVNLVITDIDMPDMDGIELLKLINQKYPTIKVLACTMHLNSWTLQKLIKHNIAGIVSKHSVLNDVENAINSALNEEKFYSKEVKAVLKNIEQNKAQINSNYNKVNLTNREQQILQYIAQGFISTQIATELSISINTIESHRRNLFLKFDVRNAMELVRKAMEKGMI